MNWLLLLGSVVGVLGLAWVARMLDLGGCTIADEQEARRLAESSQLAFDAGEIFLGTDGKSALVRGLDGRWVVLKVHGANIAARALAAPLALTTTQAAIVIATGERMFGEVDLHLAADDRDKLLAMV